MTLNEIIVSALRRLDRGTDRQTIGAYRSVFTNYANTAIKQIARQYKQCKKETVALDSDNQFNVTSLSRGCFMIHSVLVDGKPVDFYQEPAGSGLFTVKTDANSATVVYQFVPAGLSATTDIPELPPYMHDIIPYYIVACERAGGDPETQGTASVDFQLFNSQLQSILRETMGEPRSYKLMNYDNF